VASPYMVMFWIYTTLVFEWANLIHLSVADLTVGKTKMRPAFIGSNVTIMIAIGLFFVSIAARWHSTKVAYAASIVTALIYLFTGLSFAVYGVLITRQLSKVKNNTYSSIEAPSEFCGSLIQRIRFISIVIPLCFLIESIIWILSISNPNSVALTLIFGVTDILALVCVLVIFAKTIVRSIRETSSKSKASLSRHSGHSASTRGTVTRSSSPKLSAERRSMPLAKNGSIEDLELSSVHTTPKSSIASEGKISASPSMIELLSRPQSPMPTSPSLVELLPETA